MIQWDNQIHNTWWTGCNKAIVVVIRIISISTHSSIWWTTILRAEINYTGSSMHRVQRLNLVILSNIINSYLMHLATIVVEHKIMEVGQDNHIQVHHQILWDKELLLQTHLTVTWWTSTIKWIIIRCHSKCSSSNSNKTITMEDNPKDIEKSCCQLKA